MAGRLWKLPLNLLDLLFAEELRPIHVELPLLSDVLLLLPLYDLPQPFVQVDRVLVDGRHYSLVVVDLLLQLDVVRLLGQNYGLVFRLFEHLQVAGVVHVEVLHVVGDVGLLLLASQHLLQMGGIEIHWDGIVCFMWVLLIEKEVNFLIP